MRRVMAKQPVHAAMHRTVDEVAEQHESIHERFKRVVQRPD